MARTGIAPIDNAPLAVAEWLGEIREALGWEETGRAYLLLRTVLHAVRDVLPIAEATDLAAQLPLLLKGIYYDGWDPAATLAAGHSRADLVGRVEKVFSKEPLEDPAAAIRAVLALLAQRVSEGEIDHVKHAMRTQLKDLWPKP
jgi:uncharacterized protein (DUF2267 family)